MYMSPYMTEVQGILAKIWQNISDMEKLTFSFFFLEIMHSKTHIFIFFLEIMHSNDNYRVNMLTCYTVHTFPILFKE